LSVKMDKIIELLSNNPGIASPGSSKTNLSLNDFNNSGNDTTKPHDFHRHQNPLPVLSQNQPQSYQNLHHGYEVPLMHLSPPISLHTAPVPFEHFQGFHPLPYEDAPPNFHRKDNFASYNPNGFAESRSHHDIHISYQYGHSKMSPQESFSINGNYVMNGVNGVKIKNCPTSLSCYDVEDDLLNDDDDDYEEEMQMLANRTNQKLVHDQAKILKKVEENQMKTRNEKFGAVEESQLDPKLLHEQKMILKQIEEDKKKKLRDEKLSLDLIEELTRQDAQGFEPPMRNGQAGGVGYGYDGHLNHAKGSSADYMDAEFPTLQPPRIDNGWIKVAKSETKKISSNKERDASLKVAAELEKKQREALMVSEWRKEKDAREDQEVNRMLKNIEESNKLRLIKEVGVPGNDNGQMRAGCLSAAPLAQVLPMKPTVKQKANKKFRARKNGASEMNEFEIERRRIAEELKRRLECQERDRREKVQRESLSKEWESAVLRSGNKRYMNEIERT